MTRLVTPARPETVREAGWMVEVNGTPVPEVSHIKIANERFGTLSFGKRPEGTIGWGWREVDGGGVGIVSYCVFDRKLLIGLIPQDRAFVVGGRFWNIPRGFVDPRETHFESVTREFYEEFGCAEPQTRLQPLEGSPANPNSTFFDTTDGGGFQYFSFEAYTYELEPVSDVVRFKPNLITPKSTAAERVLGCSFFPWHIAAKVSDTFSNAGVARLIVSKRELLAYL